MIRIKRKCRILLLLTAGMMFLIFGCKDTQTREQIDDTVETVTGQKNVKQMDKIKKDIKKIEKKQADRLKQIDE